MDLDLVSIVILNWNGKEHVYKCIDSVIRQTYPNIEVIVVDNGSTDGSIENIKFLHKNFIFIENNDNKGYAFGMNQGITKSGGKYIIPLNQDVYLHKDFVMQCVNKIENDPQIGAVGGRVYSWVNNEFTNNIQRGEGELFFLKKRFQGYGGVRVDYDALVFRPSGCFPFLRKNMLDDLKWENGYYFDESFITGWEDMDLFFRMHLRNWKCLFTPCAYGWHVGSGSVGGKSTFLKKNIDYQVRILRNRYYTIIKNIPINIIIWLFPYLLLTELALMPYFLIRSPKSIIALISSWVHVIINMRVLYNKRKLIQKSIIVEKNYLKKYFVKF
jgi:GT2 family glycosyltransferase